MVKGLSRRVIVVSSPDPRIFEQAIFIIRNDALSGGVTQQQVVDQALHVAKDYARTHGVSKPRRFQLSPWLYSLAGAGGIGLIWLLAAVL